MKKITTRLSYSASVILIIIGIYLEIKNTSISGGEGISTKYNRQGDEITLTGITIIIIGISIIAITYYTFKDEK